ncbi:hypothetical protein AB9P05_07690 [Roseivirga sp. BDSF3-8]|uniref:hypothetical protein n=1 Tax=Roseivirga sp. BDSF3-8 TaxID=3241598 RepID=UPI003531A0D5
MSEISVQLGLHENDPKDEPFTMHLVIEEEQDENGRYAATVLDEFRDEIITLKHDQVPKLISKVADFLNEHGAFVSGRIRKSGKVAREMYRGLRAKTRRTFEEPEEEPVFDGQPVIM